MTAAGLGVEVVPTGLSTSARSCQLQTVVGVADQMGWGDDHESWGWGGWWVMMGFMVLFWVAVAVLVVWAFRLWGGSGPVDAQGRRDLSPSPMDIARERYARGEINDEEFQRIKRGLS